MVYFNDAGDKNNKGEMRWWIYNKYKWPTESLPYIVVRNRGTYSFEYLIGGDL